MIWRRRTWSKGVIDAFASRIFPLALALLFTGAAVSLSSYAQQDEEPGNGQSGQEADVADDASEDEDEVRVDENVFIPSEEISQDNAVPFPIDI